MQLSSTCVVCVPKLSSSSLPSSYGTNSKICHRHSSHAKRENKLRLRRRFPTSHTIYRRPKCTPQCLAQISLMSTTQSTISLLFRRHTDAVHSTRKTRRFSGSRAHVQTRNHTNTNAHTKPDDSPTLRLSGGMRCCTAATGLCWVCARKCVIARVFVCA